MWIGATLLLTRISVMENANKESGLPITGRDGDDRLIM